MVRNIIPYFAFSFSLILMLVRPAECKEIDYGLYIKSYPEIDSKKTSLVLNANDPISLGRELRLSFDMFVRKDNAFGVVFRLITDNDDHIDLLFTAGQNNERYPILVVNEEVHPVSREIAFGKWINVSVGLSKTGNQVSLVFDGKELSVPFGLAKASSARIAFGRCPFESFEMADIASVNIRDVKLFRNQALAYYWKLKEHNGDRALDSLNHAEAVATNPVWMLDMYATWEKVYSKKVQNNSLFAFNGSDKFYIVQPDTNKILVFDPARHAEHELAVLHGCMASNAPNQIYYDALTDELITYNIDENRYSTFSFHTRSWSSDQKGTKDPGYLNNSSVFSARDSAVFSFGGYGYYSYNNDLIRMSPHGNGFETITLSSIPPRYFSATAMMGNSLYIFAGRGNPSGRQELSPRNYYDLYSVTIPGYKVTKLWEETSVPSDFLPGENMIVDTENRAFYVLTTQVSGGRLIRITPDKQGFDTVSFPIEEDLEGLYLYTNLYYSSSQSALYALICKKKSQTETEVSIYSMNFPPISLSSIHQTVRNGQQRKFSLSHYLMLAAAVCGVSLLVWRYRRRRTHKPHDLRSSPHPAINTLQQPEPLEIGLADTHHEFSKSAICFLGGFAVIDREGNDISGQFTPTLKYLLILLILHSRKDIKGLAGRKMINFLWPDKSEESAKNNRNVYLSKLRAIADQLGQFEVQSTNETWSIKLNDVRCDYTEILDLFDRLKSGNPSDKTAIYRLLALLQRGELLPAVETDWIDPFKSEFSSTTVELLTKLLHSSPYVDNDDIRLAIADILFIHDPVNEEALHLKCSILFNSGRKGIAKHVYDNFCRDYQQLLGIAFSHSLTDIVD
ncbi:AfsR/SARP family transcriptional regulator [Parapedobacter koreensis]|uniref:AfsR/SARP family transcriptional regulator n=1 Tax=Parapedobacter koreensis TaxID=332977 RepID=UPI0015A67600|nr:hypothetical protein [Parapedobacter koreensis]